MTLNQRFRKFSIAVAEALGLPGLFVANVFLILLWLASGPVFHYSVEGARNRLVSLQNLSDDELQDLQEQFNIKRVLQLSARDDRR
jgi:hypothetical protein